MKLGRLGVWCALDQLSSPDAAQLARSIEDWGYSALWQHDAQVRLQLEDGFAFYVGVNNLTDQKPDSYSYFTNTPISPLGRYFYAGAKFNLGNLFQHK